MVLRRGGVEAFEPGVRNIVVPAVRGEILDDDGRQLVMNQTSLGREMKDSISIATIRGRI